MILSARFMTDVASINSWEYADVGEYTAGDAVELFFQLIDSSLDKSVDGFSPAGRRYVPEAGATLQVTVESIDDSREIVRLATAPYSGDRSIWKVSILSTDVIKGTANMRLKLTEGSVVRNGVVKNGIRIHSDTCL